MKLKYGEYKAVVSIKNGDKDCSKLTTWRGDFINKILNSLPTSLEAKKGETVTIVIKPAGRGENGTD